MVISQIVKFHRKYMTDFSVINCSLYSFEHMMDREVRQRMWILYFKLSVLNKGQDSYLKCKLYHHGYSISTPVNRQDEQTKNVQIYKISWSKTIIVMCISHVTSFCILFSFNHFEDISQYTLNLCLAKLLH